MNYISNCRHAAIRGLALSSVCMLSACVPQKALQPQIDGLSRGLTDVRSIQAEQVAQISSLESQVRELRGKLEEITHTQTTSIDTTIISVQDELSNLKRRVPPPALVPVDALEADEARITELSPEVGARFQNGLVSLRDGKYPNAAAIFEELYDAAFDSPLAPNILFWLAVSNEGLGETTGALRRYAEVLAKFPKSGRAPLALLRQGSLMIRLGDAKTAKVVFKKLVADYPKSAEAARARERLKEF
jgi:tol-pal system protein YbgF